MSRGRCSFRQRDLKAALKAAKDAGHEVARVTIVDGKVELIFGKPADTEPPPNKGDPDEWKE